MNIIGIINPGIVKNFNALTIITAICNYVLPFPILLFLMRKMEKQELEKQKLSFKKFLLYLS
ncbi:MAG: CPBP family intramembrane glutamate endopeptidase, partial [Methanobrevibacter sp.]